MKNKLLEGLVKRHPDGFGFFVPDDKDHPDVYIPRHSMTGVMTNDKVQIEVFPERGGDRFRGEITRVVARGTRQVVGIYSQLNDKYGLVKDEAKAWGQDLRIAHEDNNGAQNGQMVAVEILNYPAKDQIFEGRIKEILGHISDPMSDIKRVIFANQIPYDWPKKVEQEAQPLKHNPEEKDFVGRTDLRPLNLITIDGATAKDFDDAVYVETSGRGFRLIVAIADVSHYVRPSTAIDEEAYLRGTSVYFPNFVVPMLPEILSNGLCSLNPHVPRLCLVADMQFDFTGEKLKSEFYEAVMESKARVTYGQAQEIIDGNDIPEFNHVKDNILKCADLAKILMAKRFKEGSLDLEIPETELEIDSTGMPVDVIRSERLFAHRLIEEMMLAANVAVAEFLSGRDIPALYRIHESPPEQALQTLERFMHNFGSHVQLDGGKLQKRLTKALHEFEGRPEAQILNVLTLRSMSQAKYSENNLGHFGLGFEHYTHFTSPIRRYPDLIVHRLLKNQILGSSSYKLMAEDDLASAGTYLSACEQRSTKAERQIKAIKKARFMEKHVGAEFDGIITSVTKFGVFVLLREYDIDGLVRLEDLNGKFEFDEDNLRLYSKGSGFSYNMGDPLKIVVAQADIQLGQINFALAGQEMKAMTRARQESRRGPRKESRRDSQDQSRRDSQGQPRRDSPSEGRGGRRRKSSGQKNFGGKKTQSSRSQDQGNQKKQNKDQKRRKRTEDHERPRQETHDQPRRERKLDSPGRFVLKGIKASYRSRENLGGSETQSAGKNSEKRRPSEDDSSGVRKTRFSQRRRKG